MKRIITVIALNSALFASGSDDKGNWHMGRDALIQADKILNKAIDRAPDVATKAGENFVSGAATTLAKEQNKQLAQEYGKHIVKGGVEEVGNQAIKGRDALMATGAALLALPYAPYVLGLLGASAVVGTTIGETTKYRRGQFRRCLNTHIATALNERGFPSKCESPERRYAWWSPEGSNEEIEHFRGQRHITNRLMKSQRNEINS